MLCREVVKQNPKLCKKTCNAYSERWGTPVCNCMVLRGNDAECTMIEERERVRKYGSVRKKK